MIKALLTLPLLLAPIDNLPITKEILIQNWQLEQAKKSPNENQALGFNYVSATDITLNNGIAKFTATALYGKLITINYNNIFNNVDKFYNYAYFKSNRTNVGIINTNGNVVSHSGSGLFELRSYLGVFNNIALIGQVADFNTADWTPIEVDYIGAINVTDLINRGILPKDLTDQEYKNFLDQELFNIKEEETPLTDSDYIETTAIFTQSICIILTGLTSYIIFKDYKERKKKK